MSRIVATQREWISSVNSRLDAATSWMNVIPCTDSAVQGDDFELIPTVRMERGHSVEGSFSREFSLIYIVRKFWLSEVGSHSRCYRKTCLFKKRQPLVGRFSKSCSERIHHFSDPRLVCKFREIWPTGNRSSRALFTGQNKQTFPSLSRSRFCADRSQNLPAPAANNVLTVPQISSISVHFWWSYNRTSEHHSNAPQSVSNTWQSYSFFAE